MSTNQALSSVGIASPPGFAASDRDAIHEKMVAYKDSHSGTWRSFGAAWKGLVYRYRAAHEYSQTFTDLITRTNSPKPEERYAQDHALFAFSVCALSSLECFHFGAYCIASVIDAANFPVSTAKDLRFYPRDVAIKFGAHFPSDAVTLEMQQCLSSPEYPTLEEHRNVLTHRGVPPRAFHVGGEDDGKAHIPENPKAPSTQWMFTLEVDSQTTEGPRRWLENSLRGLLSTTRAFCDSRL